MTKPTHFRPAFRTLRELRKVGTCKECGKIRYAYVNEQHVYGQLRKEKAIADYLAQGLLRAVSLKETCPCVDESSPSDEEIEDTEREEEEN